MFYFIESTSNGIEIAASSSAATATVTLEQGLPLETIKTPCLAMGTQISFPSLALGGLSDTEREHLEARLYTDSVRMMGRFQTLLNTIMDSLETRQVPVKRIITQIMTFGAFDPVHQKRDQPILEHELDKLREEAGTSIDDIQYVVMKYSSFFNYHIVEQIIKTLGTQEDKLEFEKYERAFMEYTTKRKVVECPTQVALIDDINQAMVFVKLDDSYDKCTVSHLKLFVGKLSEVLNLRDGVLQLVTVKSGCFELTFQVPLFVQQATFPLSLEQEKSLAQLGVLKLYSGSYTYSCSQSDDKVDVGDDDRHDKPDDDDSAIETGTARSELTELSEVRNSNTLKPPNKGHVDNINSVPYREVVFFLEVQNIL